MKVSPFPVFAAAAALVCTTLLLPIPVQAQIDHLPKLGSPAPESLITTDKKEKQCRTGEDHRDPCAEVQIDKIRYTIAWDAQTKNVTYIFTNDPGLVTDSGLSVGGTCRVLGAPEDVGTISYMKWLIDPHWKGVNPKAGDDAIWYAALHKDDFDPHYGNIVGFVQSQYIELRK
ncbi:MAG TPA: hypothetical protein VGS02_20245 [Acidobacteriaceae bacterium]|nr:hypothetical protein [Acidobacteriaceae bacterium]